jgi:uncharacterized protein (TIGR03118 family)
MNHGQQLKPEVSGLPHVQQQICAVELRLRSGSFAFGPFSGDVLIGNFGDGKIHAFDSEGNFLGTVRDLKGKPVVIDGLWTLTLGGGRNSRSDTLYFTAGPNDETNGLFGTITPLSKR